ncbi:hypothetical protein BKA69DRAFT_1090865 [Paraphysoderma sedebokerense]|nr:hypothetical protein BKA69DRAFT_1090765 [Paraphysoderma sedebokerense]KAI9138601.1 hypothetical protein BKA69DRAFT_1090865 [Paraphysoderma sedebokerense]
MLLGVSYNSCAYCRGSICNLLLAAEVMSFFGAGALAALMRRNIAKSGQIQLSIKLIIGSMWAFTCFFQILTGGTQTGYCIFNSIGVLRTTIGWINAVLWWKSLMIYFNHSNQVLKSALDSSGETSINVADCAREDGKIFLFVVPSIRVWAGDLQNRMRIFQAGASFVLSIVWAIDIYWNRLSIYTEIVHIFSILAATYHLIDSLVHPRFKPKKRGIAKRIVDLVIGILWLPSIIVAFNTSSPIRVPASIVGLAIALTWWLSPLWAVKSALPWCELEWLWMDEKDMED